MEQASEIRRLQACINDLIGVVALAALWNGLDASRVVGTMLDAMVEMLRLDFGFARLNDPEGAPPLEVVRSGEASITKVSAKEMGQALDRWWGLHPQQWPSETRTPFGEGEMSLVPVRLGVRDDIGLIVVGCRRPGFPCETDRLLLSVAANQAAIGLQEARRLAQQKRIARELEDSVAQRTRELVAANEDLRREIEERKRVEEKVRQDEEEMRRITDLIPQAVIVLGPEGRMLHANAFVLEYTGLSLEHVRADSFREKFFHPDDLERVEDERRRELVRGEPFEAELRARRRDGRYRWFMVRYVPFCDPGGRVVRWYATGTDIEERKQAEEKVRNENLALREEIDRSSMFEEIVGSSEGLRRVLVQVAKVARTDSTVLVLGETGTGKELIARAIHKRSARAGHAFIRVNCAAIPPSLVSSELFGHEKGAFTGAVQRRLGRFEAANGGTIFLDEIGDLPAETQIALLRVLQERELERVGSSQPIPVDVRVVAATHRNLRAAVAAGSFRHDLFYRLNVFPVEIPALRERRDDIPVLVEYLVERYAKKAGKRIRKISSTTLEMFDAYGWPGNVRELQNVVERAMILSDGDTFTVDEGWLRREASPAAEPTVSLAGSLVEREREMIEAALIASKGRVSGPSGAAARLGIPRQTLDSKIQALKIHKHHFKPS
jgi:formate hydrogenlyase transcriptional activator